MTFNFKMTEAGISTLKLDLLYFDLFYLSWFKN